MPFSNYVILPAALGEVGSCLRLLAVGARVRGGHRQSTAGA